MLGRESAYSPGWQRLLPCNQPTALSEREGVGADAGVQELDLESAIRDGPGLPDELIETRILDGPPPLACQRIRRTLSIASAGCLRRRNAPDARQPGHSL